MSIVWHIAKFAEINGCDTTWCVVLRILRMSKFAINPWNKGNDYLCSYSLNERVRLWRNITLFKFIHTLETRKCFYTRIYNIICGSVGSNFVRNCGIPGINHLELGWYEECRRAFAIVHPHFSLTFELMSIQTPLMGSISVEVHWISWISKTSIIFLVLWCIVKCLLIFYNMVKVASWVYSGSRFYVPFTQPSPLFCEGQSFI